MRLAALATCTVMLLAAPAAAASPATDTAPTDPVIDSTDPCRAVPFVECVVSIFIRPFVKDAYDGLEIEDPWYGLGGKYGCGPARTISSGGYYGVLRLENCDMGFFTGYIAEDAGFVEVA